MQAIWKSVLDVGDVGAADVVLVANTAEDASPARVLMAVRRVTEDIGPKIPLSLTEARGSKREK